MTRAAPRTRTSTGELMRRLRSHYVRPAEMFPGGFLAEEVGMNAVAGVPQRRADAIYCGFTSSSGRILVGHELKVTRADWHRELEEAEKADAWADACHAWYVVAPDTTIVDPATVPEGWGLMVLDPKRPTKMKVIVKATAKGPDHNPPWWATRSIMARQDTMRGRAVTDLVARQRVLIADDAVKRAQERARWNGGGSDLTLADQGLLAAARRFQEAGVPIGGYGGDELTPEMVRDPEIRNLLRHSAKAEELRAALNRRYDGLPQVADLLRRLEAAVNAMGTPHTPH